MDRKVCDKPDLTPLIHALRRVIRCSALSQRKIEERAGFSRGYLSQLLAQNLDLKVWHLLVILDVCGVPPGELFDQVYPRTDDALTSFVGASEPLSEAADDDLDRLYHDHADVVAGLRQRLRQCRDAVVGIVEPDPAKAGVSP
ncbi:MAG: helix-turn-helix transcriptional regulator [Acidobacteriota bacterium]